MFNVKNSFIITQNRHTDIYEFDNKSNRNCLSVIFFLSTIRFSLNIWLFRLISIYYRIIIFPIFDIETFTCRIIRKNEILLFWTLISNSMCLKNVFECDEVLRKKILLVRREFASVKLDNSNLDKIILIEGKEQWEEMTDVNNDRVQWVVFRIHSTNFE